MPSCLQMVTLTLYSMEYVWEKCIVEITRKNAEPNTTWKSQANKITYRFQIIPPTHLFCSCPFLSADGGQAARDISRCLWLCCDHCLHQVFRVTFTYCPFSCPSLEISTEITNIALNSSLRLEVDHRLHSDVSVIIVFFWCPTLNTMERFKNIIQWIYHHGHLKYGHRR